MKSDLVYEVEDLLKAKQETVHARRLLLYRTDLDGTVVDPKLQRAAEPTETSYQIARGLCNIREKDGTFDVQVEWDGLPDEVDMTWEPMIQVHEDMPELLSDFLKTNGNRKLKRK